MSRPSKYTKATQTRIARVEKEMEKENIILPFNHTTLNHFLTPTKVEIVKHKAKKKVLGGGRESGKTRPAVLDLLAGMSNDNKASAMVARKYKTLASEKFQDIVINNTLEIKFDNFLISEYNKSANKIRKMKDYKNVYNNTHIECVSFEDPNSISGAEAPLLGYYYGVLIDEPVIMGDTGKVPDRETWMAQTNMIKKTIDRSNKRFARINNKPVPKPVWWICMNLWDQAHPEVEDLNNAIGDDEFVNFCLGFENVLSKSTKWKLAHMEQMWESAIKNNTKMVYNEAVDTLYVKMSSFANPFYLDDQETINEIKAEFKKAIIDNNSFLLASLLGLTFEGFDEKVNTYDIRKWQWTDSIKEYGKGTGWKVVGISFGWDVDINIELVGSCVLVVQKKHLIESYIEERLIVLPIHIIIMNHTIGSNLENNVHSSRIAKATNKIYNDIIVNFDYKFHNVKLGKHFSVDIDDRHWLPYYNLELKHFWDGSIKMAKKHDNKSKPHLSYGINTRIKMLQAMLDKSYIVFDKQNQRLYNEIVRIKKKNDGTSRDESGYKHILFNLLNSLEYALYPFRKRHNLLNEQGIIEIRRDNEI